MKIKEILVNLIRHDQNMPKSIWGRAWTRDRKLILPAWLCYEVSSRFYGYACATHNYFEQNHDKIAPYVGELGVRILGILCSGIMFLWCTAWLTVPACFALYIFLKKESISGTRLEEKIKRFAC